MSTEPSPANDLRLDFASLTDVGLWREQNEDCFGEPLPAYAAHVDSRGYLFAVADGLGGHALGEVASRLAIDTLFDAYYTTAPDIAAALKAAAAAANAVVYYQATARGVSMGTTLTAALVHEATLTVANVGDSRVYLIRDQQVRQVTQDHSVVAEHIRRGLMTEEQARASHIRNLLTRSLGHTLTTEIDIDALPIQTGDIVLLCSDGLYNLVAPDEMLAATAQEPVAAVADLVQLANRRGGPDNITCQIVRVLACPAPPA